MFNDKLLIFRICIDQSAEQERQLRSLRLEMETLQRQLESASADRENAIHENRKLQDDLAAVSCEVRNMQHELEASHAECHDLKRQLQTYVSEVRRAEELLNRKVGRNVFIFPSLTYSSRLCFFFYLLRRTRERKC